MEAIDATLDALRQLPTALRAVSQSRPWVDTLIDGYRLIGGDPASRRVESQRPLQPSFLNCGGITPFRHEFIIQATANRSLSDAWKTYAVHLENEGFEISEQDLAAGLALARLTRNCLAGSHHAKQLVR